MKDTDEGENVVNRGRILYPSIQSLFVSLIVLLLLILMSKVLASRELIVPESTLTSFPSEIGPWKSHGGLTMDQKFIDILQLSDYINRWYSSPSGKAINVYIGFVPEQDQRPMIHSPTTCLPGSGWSILDKNLVPWWVGPEDKKESMVNLVLMGLGSDRQLVCYWIQANQRIMPGLFQYRFYLLVDSIFKKRSDGALVRFITRLAPNESIKDGEERLKYFVKAAIPFINKELPD